MNTQLKISLRIIALIVFALAFGLQPVKADDLRQITDFAGTWKFSIGDNLNWANPEFNDMKWDNVQVPRSWEENGYENYNGYAWYRKTFSLNAQINDKFVYLQLGYIDDADEVYVNGKLIGGLGVFPPNVETAYRVLRKYPVPVDLLNTNSKNTIAIRVYDFYEQGGIIGGKLGLFTDRDVKLLNIDLSGYWDFETEPMMKERQANNTPKTSTKIFVPGYWESAGYNNFDGKARYVKDFRIPSDLSKTDLYLVLGFIDDVETVYINKQKIGSVFALEEDENTGLPYDRIFRTYKIPNEVLNKNGLNTLSVMVYDKSGVGGIYAGPIGITTKENYKLLKRANEKKQSSIELFFNSFKY